ncbi:MAG TPA: archease [Acidimicrobiia bacterium]|nr:archease [Acidimicrobiia bacterium]
MSYRPLPHAADTGIEATADTLAGLIEQLGLGMFALMAPLPSAAAHRHLEFTVESGSLPDLVVDILSALLYQAEVEGLIICDLAVDLDEAKLGAGLRAGGVEAEEVELSGPPIKAVTYHQLAVEKTPAGWYGRVFFDV